MTADKLVTRFAPSPTGELHLGNARTALFNFLLARHAGGQFILRIEDTDVERSRPEHIQALIGELRWLGLDWDQGPDCGGPAASYLQSQRSQYYSRRFSELESRGLTYPCFCSSLELDLSRRAQLAAGKPPRYAGTCRALTACERDARIAAAAKPSLRFRVPSGEVVLFDDFVHGPQRFATDDIGDFIIRRADGSAAFFFSNAFDDAAMGVTDVLRGEDHLTNTPRQLLLLRALDLPLPRYGHVALLVGSDGAPLSKRHGAASVRSLREQGYLPLAIVNHLFRLGHSGGADGYLSMQQMIAGFDRAHLGRAPARSDNAQLAVWQRDAAHALDANSRSAWLDAAMPERLGATQRAALVQAIGANVTLPADARHWADVVYGAPPVLDEAAGEIVRAAGGGFFAAAAAAVQVSDNDWKALANAVKAATGCAGPKLFKPLRCALTGSDHGPELGPLLALMSKQQIHERLQRFATP